MKIITIILFFSLINLNAQTMTNLEKVNEVITSVKNNFAPDKRTAIFDISASEENGKIIISGETNLTEAKANLLKALSEYKVEEKIIVLPEEELGDKFYGVINLSVANMRANPQHSAELVTQALLGTPVKIYKKKGGWFLIQTPDEYLGWVDDDGVEQMNECDIKDWNSSEKIIYTKEYGFSFLEKDENSLPVSDLVGGNILKKVEINKDFIEVEYPDKRRGFIPGNSGKEFNVWLGEINPDDKNIISTAKTFMGIPYLWGGTSTKGFDCSGFTKTVFYLNGLILPRDASQQVNTGELVDTGEDFENLKPGDLLFFGYKGNEEKRERITHVGIYIGDKEFIHSSGRVRINSLDKSKENFSEFRYRTFIRAKRIINSDNSSGIKEVKNLFHQ